MLVVVVLVVVDDVPGGGGGVRCYRFAADVVRLAPWSLWVPCGCWARAVCDKAVSMWLLDQGGV